MTMLPNVTPGYSDEDELINELDRPSKFLNVLLTISLSNKFNILMANSLI